MINKLNKKKIETFLTYYGVIFLVLSALIFVGWHYILSAIDEVKPYERVNIFIEAYHVDESLKEGVYSYVKEKDTTSSIYQVNVYNFSPDNNKIANYYSSFGQNADLVILTDKDLEDMGEYIDDNFLSLSDELLDESLKGNVSKYEYYSYEGQKYAIKLYSKDDTSYSYLSSYISFTSEDKDAYSYYLLLNINSVNVGSYNEYNATSNALIALNYLLGGRA
jgi:hypothetical protein